MKVFGRSGHLTKQLSRLFVNPFRRQRVLEAFEGGEPSRIVFLAPDQKSGRGPAKSGQQNGAHAKALHLEASTHAAFLSQSNLNAL